MKTTHDNIESLVYLASKERVREVNEVLDIGEDEIWQFKPQFEQDFCEGHLDRANQDNLADEIAAFANGEGGTLIIGLYDTYEFEDEGTYFGFSYTGALELCDRLEYISECLIKPPVFVDSYPFDLSVGSGKGNTLRVKIFSSKNLHESPGGYFRRKGTSKQRLVGKRLYKALRRSRIHSQWFDEQPVPNTEFATLSEDLWKPLLSHSDASRPEVALRKMRLLNNHNYGFDQATVAGVLICTPNPEEYLPNACITATHYSGGDRTTPHVDTEDITGPLGEQIWGAVSFVCRNMKDPVENDSSKVLFPQYLSDVIFEAIVNAVVHRDYSVRGSRIRLSMFNDRLEIQSRGTLPNNLTIEDIAVRQSIRNLTIASVMAMMPVGEVRNTLAHRKFMKYRDEHKGRVIHERNGREVRQSDSEVLREIAHHRYFMSHRGHGYHRIRECTWYLSGKYPQYHVINDSEVLLEIPAANQYAGRKHATVHVCSGDRPLPKIDLLIFYPNNTWTNASTNDEGDATVLLRTTKKPMTIFVAAPGFSAHIERDWIPSKQTLAIELRTLLNGGSAILPNARGHLPGLKGWLHSARSQLGRIYLCAIDISVNDGAREPVPIIVGTELKLKDSTDKVQFIRIVEIIGRSVLLEYRDVKEN